MTTRYGSFSAPLQSINLEKELDELALALDEVASLIAAHPSFAGIPDIDNEPLESLMVRGAEIAGMRSEDAMLAGPDRKGYCRGRRHLRR
jgi:hypothetical protein